MALERKPSTFLNGVPELLILRLLTDRPMYGYEIVAAIRGSTRELLSFGEGIVYPILHELERDGLLATRKTTVNGRPRVYYRLTPAGRRKLERTTGDWMRIVQAVQHALGASPPAVSGSAGGSAGGGEPSGGSSRGPAIP